jgi:hypothetical protein
MLASYSHLHETTDSPSRLTKPWLAPPPRRYSHGWLESEAFHDRLRPAVFYFLRKTSGLVSIIPQEE